MFNDHSTACARRGTFLVAVALLWLGWLAPAHGQFVTQQVGGVSIDVKGIVKNVQVDEVNDLKRVRQQALQPVPGDLKQMALRKISLRQLEAAIVEHRAGGGALSDSMRYLAGMQRIQYVLVYPEQNDIVLAGPGEGWKLNAQGDVVGLTTNWPVMLLDDLLVALRSTATAQQTGITCSIDPTPEGVARLQGMLKQIYAAQGDPSEMLPAIEEAMGPQTITIRGVPDTSHFARVLVAADYRMKRLAMAFEQPPIQGLPNYLQMVKTSGKARPMAPRWWLAPDYDALLASADGLAWELRGAAVKTLTEEEVVSASGALERAGQANPQAKKWADNMTAHYEELAKKDAVFGQLRNCVDLAVVAALIAKENLTEKCGWSMPLLVDHELPVEAYNSPQHVDTQASLVRKSNGTIISASGGVSIIPGQMLEKMQASPALESVRSKSIAPAGNWWWN